MEKPRWPPAPLVYEVNGDRLTIVTADEGRPTDLGPGKSRRVFVYEPEKS
jgi:hypothetical protein